MTRKLNARVLSTYRSEVLGIITILILIFHVKEYHYMDVSNLPILNLFISRGSIGVDSFLFFSGISLYFSMKKNPEQSDFLLRRIKRLLIPTYIIWLPYWLYLLLSKKVSFGGFFLDASLLRLWVKGNGSVWYISAILALYLVYPYLYNLVLTNHNTRFSLTIEALLIVYTFLAMWVIHKYNPDYYGVVEIFIGRIPSFLMGAYIGKMVYEQTDVWIGLFIISIPCLLLFYCAVSYVSAHSLWWIRALYPLGGISLSVLLTLVIYCLEERWQLSILCRVLSWFGKRSLDIYLAQILVRGILNQLYPVEDRIGFPTLLLLLLTILMSIMCHELTRYLNELSNHLPSHESPSSFTD